MFVLNFNLKEWIYYPEKVRRMITRAHRANFYRCAIKEKYDQCKFGEEKTKLYMTLVSIERICNSAKNKVRFCEVLNLGLYEYVKAEDKNVREFKEELEFEERASESEFKRVEETYYKLKERR